jgi:hypothetical protein
MTHKVYRPSVIPREALDSAKSALTFDGALLANKTPHQPMIGKPYRCHLELVYDLGRVYAATQLGSARPHNAVWCRAESLRGFLSGALAIHTVLFGTRSASHTFLAT